MTDIFIVAGYNNDTEEQFEFEHPNMAKALEIYDILKEQPGITNLQILNYDLMKKQYHFVV